MLTREVAAVSTTTPLDATASAITLIRRYRDLCEARGLARAHRLPLEPALDEELVRLEEEIIARLSSTGQQILQSSVTSPGDLAAMIYSDGAAEGNPGPGGYCALVRIAGRPDREISGGVAHTTNNKMELTAAIVGLQGAIEAGATTMTVVSDSEYLIKGMTRWLAGWISKKWQTAANQPVKNRDLWEQLSELSQARSIRWTWVRGHAGNPENERCDRVATAAARQAARKNG
jgi:ribonuclease HI